MNNRREALANSIREYKLSIIRAKEQKRSTQQDFAKFWRQQMDWRSEKVSSEKNQPYNPDEVWTVEGPTRRKDEAIKRKADNSNMKQVLDEQAQFYRTMRETERKDDLAEGRTLCQDDLAKKDLERQLVAFKKQMFRQEMLKTWEKQVKYRRTLKRIEDLF